MQIKDLTVLLKFEDFSLLMLSFCLIVSICLPKWLPDCGGVYMVGFVFFLSFIIKSG